MIRRACVPLGLVALLASGAAAQSLGMPVMNNGIPTGINVAADVGFAGDDYYGGGTAIGGRATVGLGFFGVSGVLSYFNPKEGDGVWSPGASATLRLLGGPLIPFRVTLQAAGARWSVAGQDFTHVPVSLGLSATIPNPALAIKPWIAPRLDVMHSSGTSIEGEDLSDTDVKFGISGGVDLSLLNGMSIRAAYDRVNADDGVHPSVFSLGLGFAP